jgi:hypothetical protein
MYLSAAKRTHRYNWVWWSALHSNTRLSTAPSAQNWRKQCLCATKPYHHKGSIYVVVMPQAVSRDACVASRRGHQLNVQYGDFSWQSLAHPESWSPSSKPYSIYQPHFNTLEQAFATYSTRVKRGTRNDFQCRAEWTETQKLWPY